MRLLTSVLAGLAAVVLAFALCILLVFVFPLVVPMMLRSESGSAGIGAVSIGIGEPLVLGIAGVAFAAGFIWRFRRAGRTR